MMNIHEVWMRLEALAHLRDYGPRLQPLKDKIEKELHEVSDSLVAKPVDTVRGIPRDVFIDRTPKTAEERAIAEQAEARREAARKSLEATAQRPIPAVGQQDQTDAEAAGETVERRV